MDTREKVSNLLTVIQRLGGILTKENAALARHRPDLIEPSLLEKQKLSKAYELLAKALQDEAEDVKELDKAVRERLSTAMTSLDELTEQNAKLLKIAIDANQRVLDAIAKAAQTTMPQNNSYSRNGSIGPTPSQSVAHGMPLSVNQTL